MKLLVTGGAGFIGSNFIHYWFSKNPNDEIVNIDKLTYAADLANLNGVEKYKYTFVKGDIADKETVDRIAKDVDAIVNFAAETHVDNSIVDSKEFVQTNVMGTHSLLEAARKHEKRYHQISTDEVYGSLPLDGKEKFTELTSYNPRNPYSATKAAADHLVRAYCNTYKLNATISNCSNNFGPNQHQEKLIPKTIINATKNQKIPVYGRGANVRDWVYVLNHCSAIDVILKKGVAGETYLVGEQNERTNIELVRMILAMMGKPESLIEFVKDRPGHDLRYALDSTKIRKELGWKPEHDFEASLKQTIEFYMNR